MIGVGFILLWGAYGVGVWAYSLVRGWNLGAKDIWSPTSYYQGTWPPATAGNCTVIPDGTQASLTSDTQTAGASTATGSTASAGTAPQGISNNAAIQQAASVFGWGSGQQWACLTNVVNAESGGNPLATNPSSGAFGIAQALGHGVSGTAGCGRNEYGGNGLSNAQAQQANCGNAYYQAYWMMAYIKTTYGNPCAAWAHEQSNHWY